VGVVRRENDDGNVSASLTQPLHYATHGGWRAVGTAGRLWSPLRGLAGALSSGA